MGTKNHFSWLLKPVSIAPLVIFRLLFGSLILFGTIRFMAKGWVKDFYILPHFHFTYFGFGWINPLAGNEMYIPFILLILTSLMVIFGLFYRIASSVLFLAFTYIELIDKTTYLNHYYLMTLIAFLMCFLPAHRDFSLDVKWKISPQQLTIRILSIRILQFQLGIVYFFAGIAKLNSDWLFRAEPLHSWLNGFGNLPILGDLLTQNWTAFLFSWVGCIYDLLIVFLLLAKKTRPFAYALVVIFHLMTWILFPIGVFPWVMIFLTLVFFSTEFHEKIVRFLKVQFSFKDAENIVSIHSNTKNYFVLIGFYVLIQLAIPLRFLLYPGNLFWNEEGFRFSWRVMVMQKTGHATFYVVDKKTQRSLEINNRTYLNGKQELQMSTQPDMIIQYAHYLHHVFQDTLLVYGKQQFHLVNPEIKANIDVSLNGRASQKMVSKNYDLAKLPYNLYHRNWLETAPNK